MHRQYRAGTSGRVHCTDSLAEKQTRDFRRFRGDKSQAVEAVASQDPTHRAVAEAAMAIEDDHEPIAELIKLTHTYQDAIANGRDSIRLAPTLSLLY